jgi:hemerythrin-like metal-binding protein
MNTLNDTTLGIPEMDAAHKELFYMLAQLQDASDEDFASGSHELLRALEEDLRAEDELMSCHAYNDRDAHLAEHARILACLRHAMDAEDRCQARRAMRLLPVWLQAHMNTMDVALAVALKA